MKFYLCLDDTDNVTSIGTGALVEMIKARIIEENLGSCGNITRHQLLIDPEIPYTSHNSAMCLEGDTWPEALFNIREITLDVLKENAAIGSDPGFCMVENPTKQMKEMMIAYGKRATLEVLNKESAYDLATRLGIHLSEHGGTGQGVIGALAGIGLRLSGNHGEAKGILKKVAQKRFEAHVLKTRYKIDRIETITGDEISENAIVEIYNPTKVVLKDAQFTLIVRAGVHHYLALDKDIIRQTQMGIGFYPKLDVASMVNQYHKGSKGCIDFMWDVAEECLDDKKGLCYNCQYRRWEVNGFQCLYKTPYL